MKALTLTQPWATLVAIGDKHIETRSWQTHYRGPLAIHAAKGIPKGARDWFLENNYASMVLAGQGVHWATDLYNLPRGMVIATCTLADIERADSTFVETLSDQEFAFGDYSEGRFAWHLTGVTMLPEPIPAKGSLGLWEWSEPK